MNGLEFWKNVAMGSVDECWEWQRCKNAKGYGMLRFGSFKSMQKAYRVAWMLTYGPIPLGKHVLHKCDDPTCCNPRHLYIGTNKENVRDRKTRGRQLCGEKTARAKLTVDQVREIRKRYAADEFLSMEKLGKEYGITPGSVYNIIVYISWRHVDPDGEANIIRRTTVGERAAKAKMTREEVVDLRRRATNGEATIDLAKEYGISRYSAYKIIKRQSWKHVKEP